MTDDLTPRDAPPFTPHRQPRRSANQDLRAAAEAMPVGKWLPTRFSTAQSAYNTTRLWTGTFAHATDPATGTIWVSRLPDDELGTNPAVELLVDWLEARAYVIGDRSSDISGDLTALVARARFYAAALGLNWDDDWTADFLMDPWED